MTVDMWAAVFSQKSGRDNSDRSLGKNILEMRVGQFGMVGLTYTATNGLVKINIVAVLCFYFKNVCAKNVGKQKQGRGVWKRVGYK